SLLGAENVLVEEAQLAPYNKIMMSAENADHAPSAALTATTVEQVQDVVRICNEHKIPVWTISTGRNFGYGSAAPVRRGQVILDLKLTARILKLDAAMCCAGVEPGGAYGPLYKYTVEPALRPMPAFPAPSAIAGPLCKSVGRGVG